MKNNKWFDSVIKSFVEKNSFVNYKIIIKGLSEKQVNTFKSCMKFDYNRLYRYENEDYEVYLIYSKESWKCSLKIVSKKLIKIDDIKGAIENLKEEIAEETNEEFIKEDTEELIKLENELKQLVANI